MWDAMSHLILVSCHYTATAMLAGLQKMALELY